MKTVRTLATIVAGLALVACGDAPVVAPPVNDAPADIHSAESTREYVRGLTRPDVSSAADLVGTHCATGEAVVYTCAVGPKVASLCVGADLITYRFGPLAAPELDIASTGFDGKAHRDEQRGGGGGEQTSVRFSSKGKEHIVYFAELGALTDKPGAQRSGVVVMEGDAELSRIDCPEAGPRQKFGRSQLPVEEDPDARYAIWF